MRKFIKIIASILCVVMAVSLFGIRPVKAQETGVRGYVSRLYEYVLQRGADSTGLDYWEDKMNNGTTAAEVAWGFFNSDEFKNRDLDNGEYVDILYRSILGREADEAGKADWVKRIKEGYPRNQVLAGFIESTEFGNICNSYGVTRGSIKLTDTLDVNYKAAQFVTRAYKIILQREPDEAGLRDWVSKLAAGKATASDIIYGFFASDEFIARDFSDEEYVEFLYLALLSRSSDEAGRADWVNLITNSYVSRMYLLKGFIDSAEFGSLCDSYGIKKGTFTSSLGKDRNPAANQLIYNSYMVVFGREPEDEELNHWGKEFYNGISATNFLNSLYGTDSFKSKSLEGQIIAIYKSALGRSPEKAEITNATNVINSSGLTAFLDSIYHSTEFDTYCQSHGVGTFFNAGLNTINGRIFYFTNGALASGWQRIDGFRYYFDPNDGCAATVGWKYIDGYKFYFDADGKLQQNVEALIGHQDKYYLTVNTYTNTVMVYAYDSSNGTYDIPVKAIVCSCGTAGNDTITGDFVLERLQAWRILSGDVYGQYCTRISGNYLFHSAWFYEAGNHMSLSVNQYNKLGNNASHGCVRLTTIDAKWIFENCNGSSVHVFCNDQSAPFDKPSAPKAVPVNGDYGYDPTDPAL